MHGMTCSVMRLSQCLWQDKTVQCCAQTLKPYVTGWEQHACLSHTPVLMCIAGESWPSTSLTFLQGGTPLHTAASRGGRHRDVADMIKLLLAAGADVNARALVNVSALFASCVYAGSTVLSNILATLYVRVVILRGAWLLKSPIGPSKPFWWSLVAYISITMSTRSRREPT